MIKAGIIGATGYAGAELYRLLLSHPTAKICALSSVSFEGSGIESVYPSFTGAGMELLSSDEVIEKSDVVFASLPHGLSEELAKKSLSKGAAFIDLGADFRLRNEDEHECWYGGRFSERELHDLAVYGLCEQNRDKIKGARLVANPGCYPTSAALGLYPVLKLGLCNTDDIIIDAKSGVTGAGRAASQTTHYPECNEAFSPYKVGGHRHTPEIEQTLSDMAGEGVKVTFVPHLLPVNRGIVSTIYIKKKQGLKLSELHDACREFYKDEFFVRLLPLGQTANLKNVRLSNFCHISLHEDDHTGRFIVVSAIDNMVKGAAGQAIQNMNLMTGQDERAGLTALAPAF